MRKTKRIIKLSIHVGIPRSYAVNGHGLMSPRNVFYSPERFTKLLTPIVETNPLALRFKERIEQFCYGKSPIWGSQPVSYNIIPRIIPSFKIFNILLGFKVQLILIVFNSL